MARVKTVDSFRVFKHEPSVSPLQSEAVRKLYASNAGYIANMSCSSQPFHYKNASHNQHIDVMIHWHKKMRQ